MVSQKQSILNYMLILTEMELLVTLINTILKVFNQ